MGTEERDHVILINAVARNADAANNPAATIDRHATRENLQAVLQPVLTRHNLRKRGANRGRVSGRRACDEGQVLAEGTPSEIVNNADVRRVYLGENFRM